MAWRCRRATDGQFAGIGKAFSSPGRELLAQVERTVDSLAPEIGLSLANASQYLQAFRRASLVETRKEGLYVYYRLADPAVSDLSRAIGAVAKHRLAELKAHCPRTLRRPSCDRAGEHGYRASLPRRPPMTSNGEAMSCQVVVPEGDEPNVARRLGCCRSSGRRRHALS